MRGAGLSGYAKRRKFRTTFSVAGVRVADDLVERDFKPRAPNRLYASDIKYLDLGGHSRRRCRSSHPSTHRLRDPGLAQLLPEDQRNVLPPLRVINERSGRLAAADRHLERVDDESRPACLSASTSRRLLRLKQSITDTRARPPQPPARLELAVDRRRISSVTDTRITDERMAVSQVSYL